VNCEECAKAETQYGVSTLCVQCANHEAKWRREAMGDVKDRMICQHCRLLTAHNSALINEIERRDREDEKRRFLNGDKV